MFENLSKSKKLDKAKEMFMDAVNRDYQWQIDAREDFRFRDGHQWTTDERRILEEELRPVLTFNLIKAGIDLIMGMNEDQRSKYRATGVEPSDEYLAEILNEIVDWVTETHEFEEEEDGAFESAIIAGRGWVALDFVPDPDKFGEIKITEIDVPIHEVHFDPASRRPNMQDASYIVWDRWMSVEDFKMKYPKVSKKKIKELVADTTTFGGSMDMGVAAGTDSQHAFEIPVDDYDDADYDRPLDYHYFDRNKNMIRVIHMEYWESFKKYFAFNPESGQFELLPAKPTKEQQLQFFEAFGQEMVVEEMMDKRVKWLQFTGDEILYDDVSPLAYKGFSIVPVFAFRDISKRTSNHFGMVRLMKDPQKEVNKRWSQALNMLNQQVQPGVYAETDAFVDARQAEQSMKEAGAITWVNSGALTGGKIQERDVPTFPNAPMQMEAASQDIMKKITGVNPDLLGQDRGRQEAGVVVRMRQQQGMTLLKPLFKHYNTMKKGLFKRQLAVITMYMPDSQILRILGQGDRYTITPEGVIVDNLSGNSATLRDIRNLDYNIAAEPTSGSLSSRMLELSALLEMADRIPVPPEQIIEKLDLPLTEKQRWLEYVQTQQQTAAQMAMQEKQLEASFKDREIKVDEQKNILDFLVDTAKINQMAQKDEKKMVMDFQKLNLEEQQSILEFAAKAADIAQRAQAEKQVTQTQGGAENGTKRSETGSA